MGISIPQVTENRLENKRNYTHGGCVEENCKERSAGAFKATKHRLSL